MTSEDKEHLMLVRGLPLEQASGILLELRKKKWISVIDALPEKPMFVIAHKSNGLVLGLYFSADREFRYSDQDQTDQVTHWMPLPEPPKV